MKTGIYIHIPFCRKKCGYCAFYSGSFPDSTKDAFVKALIREIETRSNEIHGKEIGSVYIGGGTPSILNEAQFSAVTKALRNVIDSENGFITENGFEFTIEVNPEDVTEEKIKFWKEEGVNRVSLGIQSLNDEELRLIMRGNDAQTAIKAARTLREHFDNFSLDLMFGLPGQTMNTLKTTLEDALNLNPDHVSLYSLTYEERSLLTLLREQGKIVETSEDVSVGMFEMLSEKLREEGFRQYEISNYCRPGFESHHNSSYWSGDPYIGYGPGACGYNGKDIRTENPASLKEYIRFFSEQCQGNSEPDASKKHFYNIETLDKENRRDEYIMTRLRTASGINLVEFAQMFGEADRDQIEHKADSFISTGQLELSGNNLCLTRKGVMTADNIIVELSM